MRRERDAAASSRDSAIAERDRVLRVRQGPPRPPAGAVEPAVRVLGPVGEHGDEPPADASGRDEARGGPPAEEPLSTIDQPTQPHVPLIDDQAPPPGPSASASSRAGYAAAGGEPKPLLTRAAPLDGGLSRMAIRAAALVALAVAVVILLILLL